MQNIFDVDKNANNSINRSPYDWRHTNHFSCRLGIYYPLLSKLVPPNTKLKIKADLGLQFDPMSFPVQTPFKARMSFFKVPLRILWKDYKDYIGNFRDDLEEPFHDIPDTEFENFFATSKLADYLDLPTTIYTNDNSLSPDYSRETSLDNYYFISNGKLSPYTVGSSISANPGHITDFTQPWYIHRLISYRQSTVAGATRLIPGSTYNINFDDFPSKLTLNTGGNVIATSGSYSFSMDFIALLVDQSGTIHQVINYDKDNRPFFRGKSFNTSDTFGYNIESWTKDFQFVVDKNIDPEADVRLVFAFILNVRNIEYPILSNLQNMQSYTTLEELDQFPNKLSFYIEGQLGYGTFTPLTLEFSPIYSSDSKPEGKKLSCYRARAYECIYNSYFRDQRNNPLYDEHGKPVYNKWLLNYDGGADRTVYKLRKCNWEKDFLTTALPSPQQGATPLVGLTQYITEVPQPDGSNLSSYQLALVDEQGKKYKVTYSVNDDGISGYTIGVDGVLPDDTPVASIDYNKMMLNNINYGISIPDFRVVNSYQKYVELNMLKGFSYKDIIEGRYDCKVRFDELLMPEFIGGFTREINMNRVVQSVDVNTLSGAQTDTYKGSLGSLSGDAFLSTNGETPDISVFCDEECLIMGIMSIVPQPAYSQLIPKDYFYRDVLDHFNPEFDNLGYQPISYAEVCLLQCKAFGINPDDTFGYQRPWYEYVSQPDTVHGLLRTTKRDFIMNRNFNTVPMLTESFLLVDDRQLNDVFQANTGDDPIIGQCFFNITTELPISRRTQRRIE